jgi:hypothetical protein
MSVEASLKPAFEGARDLVSQQIQNLAAQGACEVSA